ncbi:hemicentin-2-like isoform X2 [Liolophura sinensis]|uniref:hemicentin-2-like isoform X2 n=1 Tax=Liolophura sinensis TaxID=3198878 RepID=UPI003158FB22
MPLSGAISQWDFTRVDRKACSSCKMAGSGCGCDHRRRREVILSCDRVACDFDPLSVPHQNDSWCGNSAIRTCTVPMSDWKPTCRTDQRQQLAGDLHGHLPSLQWAKWRRFGHGPFPNSLHNSLWYFFIFTVLLFSQSLQVSAQSFTRRPSNQRPILGEDVILQCAYSSNDSPIILWQHGPKLLFAGQIRQQGVSDRYSLVNASDLKITGVTLGDSGSYTCTPSGVTAVQATVTVLVAPGVPEITLDGSTSPLTEGASLTLTCNSTGGNPSPTLVWKRNGQEVNAGPTTKGPNAGDPASRQLTRQLDWTDHLATYTCEAVNEVNQAQPASKSQTLQVRYSPRITFGSYNPYRILEGASVTLTCEVSAFPTNGMTFKWEKDGVRLPQISNALLFPRVEKTDSGTYTCFVFNGIGKEKNESILLDVQYGPEIVEWQNQVIVNESDSVNLTCKSIANPIPGNVKWTSSNGISQYNPSLIFDRILRRDADNYTCMVTNRVQPSGGTPESIQAEKIVELLVQYPPGVPTFHPMDTPNVGDRVEIKCLFPEPGFPVGTIEWQKEGTSEIVTGDVYTIETATLSDSGVYKCRGKNLMGTGDWSRIQLNVNEPPRFVATLPASQNVNITEIGFRLQCQVRGRPQPDVQWRKNGIPFDVRGDGDFYRISQSAAETSDSQSSIVTSTLAFKGFQRLHREDGREDQLLMEDTANYTCASGAISQTIQIFVQYAPLVTVTPLKVAQDANSTVTFTCLAKSNPEPIFEWHFNEQVLNSDGKYRIQSGGRGQQEYEYTSILTVSQASQSDHGTYKCTATNSQGTNTQTAAIVDKSVPDACKDLKVLGMTWNSVFLDWTPGFNGGEDQTFMVYYTSDKHSDNVEAPRNGFNISGLHPSTSYTLRVAGVNRRGTGPKSAPINVTTMNYNFTVPTAVKFEHASNTLSFEPPGPGYFAKVEVWINDEQGWQVSEERANTEGGSIRLKEENIKKCRVCFCLELQPYVCSSSVQAESVGDPATPASGDLPTEGVVAIACVCALIIIGLCIILVCVIRKKKQDKAAKDYELETQANRRSQPINNPKDIHPKRGYDNPDFTSHQIQRNGHVATAPIPNGKLNDYKPPMNTENSFESGDMNKYDDYDHNHHHSDPHYNYDRPQGDYIERPPSHLKDPSVSGQESGYSTPEPTKPKKVIYEVVV